VGVRRIEDLVAWQLSREFKLAVYRLVKDHPRASSDLRYRDQLWQAASSGEANVDEGFHRYTAGEFVRFLSYARASVHEAVRRVADGIDRGHFTPVECDATLVLGRRAAAAIAGLQRSLKPFTRRGQRHRS
jgi:four helix bundle protein